MEWRLLPIQEEREEGFLWFQFTTPFPVGQLIQTPDLRDTNSKAFILKNYTWHLDITVYGYPGH